MRFALSLIGSIALVASAYAQQPTSPAWTYPQLTTVAQQPAPLPQALPNTCIPTTPSGPIATGLPERTILAIECPPPSTGQQHWVALNLGVFQPFTGRVEVKILPRENNSIWIEAYYGSALFAEMYGFGIRVQHTAHSRRDDHFMISPGFGVHILPNWETETTTNRYDPYFGYSYYTTEYSRNSLYYLFGDVDFSWLHDFSPHFAYEVGIKVGIAGLVSGKVGKSYPNFLMWGKSMYPIFSVYSGFRF